LSQEYKYKYPAKRDDDDNDDDDNNNTNKLTTTSASRWTFSSSRLMHGKYGKRQNPFSVLATISSQLELI